jgi:hypothetical protein
MLAPSSFFHWRVCARIGAMTHRHAPIRPLHATQTAPASRGAPNGSRGPGRCPLFLIATACQTFATPRPTPIQCTCTSATASARYAIAHPGWRGHLFAIKETYLSRKAHGRAIHARLSLTRQMSSRKVRSRTSLRGQRSPGRENCFPCREVRGDQLLPPIATRELKPKPAIGCSQQCPVGSCAGDNIARRTRPTDRTLRKHTDSV